MSIESLVHKVTTPDNMIKSGPVLAGLTIAKMGRESGSLIMTMAGVFFVLMSLSAYQVASRNN